MLSWGQHPVFDPCDSHLPWPFLDVFGGVTWNHDKDKNKDQGNKNRACRAKTMVSIGFRALLSAIQQKYHLLDLVFLLLLAVG